MTDTWGSDRPWYTVQTQLSPKAPPEMSEWPVEPCKACSNSGWYVDYAGPGVTGGILVECKKCGGKGWKKAEPK